MSLDFNSLPDLTTERLVLRRLVTNDANALFDLRSNEQVNQYITRPLIKSSQETTDFINKINQGIEQNESLYWAITLRESSTLIGTVCLWKFAAYSKGAEVGYELNPDYQRRGIMSEVLHAIIRLGFGTLELKIIEAFTHLENAGSIKLLEKHNFKIAPKRKDSDNMNNIIFVIRAEDYLA